MNKRQITKTVADQIVVAVCALAAKKTLHSVAPNMTESHATTTTIVAGTAGVLLHDKLQTPTHAAVDFVFDKIETRKSKKTAN